VVYDTGSGWLTISTTSCTNCYSDVYDPSNSTTSNQTSTNEATLSYGSATLQGYTYTDTVCVEDDDFCAYMELFGIVSQQGLNSEDGILGLSPQYTNDISLVWSLYNAGVIG